MAFIAGIDLGLERSACSYATMASSRLPINSARLPVQNVSRIRTISREDSYRSASRQLHSSPPFVAQLAIAVAEVPWQPVVEHQEHQEDHDVFACLREAMDGESP
jgi:hypothetical protein